MHERRHVTIEYNGSASGRRRVCCCVCELPATTRALFALPEDVFLSFSDSQRASIDPEDHSLPLSDDQLVYASLWRPERTVPVVLASARTASERFLGGVPSRTYAAIESLAQTIFISDTVQLFDESGAAVQSDEDVMKQSPPLEFTVRTDVVMSQLSVRVDARFRRLGSLGLLLLRGPADEQLFVESAESVDVLLANIAGACSIRQQDGLRLLRFDQPLHTLQQSSIAALQPFHVSTSRGNPEQVLPWACSFRVITCKVACPQFMNLTNDEHQQMQFRVIVDTSRWTGLAPLAQELKKQLQMSEQVQMVAFKSVGTLASLPDVVDLYLEISVRVVNVAADGAHREVTIEPEWTRDDLALQLKQLWGLPAQKHVQLSIQRGALWHVEPIVGSMPVLAQLQPLDHILLEYCSVSWETCMSARISRGESVTAPLRDTVEVDGSLRRLSCGHRVCGHCVLHALCETRPFSEAEIKAVPSINAGTVSGAAEEKGGDKTSDVHSNFDRIARERIRVADRNGVLLTDEVLEYKDVACPVQNCTGFVPQEVLASIPAVERAAGQALADQQAWLTARPCALEPIMHCEPWPMAAMMSVGDCSHFFHLDCLAAKIQSEINSENFDTLVCPGCQMENNHEPCRCVVCDLGGRGERHRITQQEMLHLVRQGHLGEPDLQRWLAREAVLSMTNFAEAEGHVIVNCTNCPNVFLGDPNWTHYRCRECNYPMCKHCRREVHPDQTCDAALQQRMRAEAARLFEQYAATVDSPATIDLPFQYCPKCHTPGGLPLECDHVTCTQPNCRTDFCFVCGCYRDATLAHEVSFHRPGCRFYRQCCDNNCVGNGTGCVHDQPRPQQCSRCREAGGMCQRPQNPAEGDLCIIHDYDDLERRKQAMATRK